MCWGFDAVNFRLVIISFRPIISNYNCPPLILETQISQPSFTWVRKTKTGNSNYPINAAPTVAQSRLASPKESLVEAGHENGPPWPFYEKDISNSHKLQQIVCPVRTRVDSSSGNKAPAKTWPKNCPTLSSSRTKSSWRVLDFGTAENVNFARQQKIWAQKIVILNYLLPLVLQMQNRTPLRMVEWGRPVQQSHEEAERNQPGDGLQAQAPAHLPVFLLSLLPQRLSLGRRKSEKKDVWKLAMRWDFLFVLAI